MADHAPELITAAARSGGGLAGRLRRFGDWCEAHLSPSPDLGGAAMLTAVALSVGLAVCVMLVQHWTLHRGMGDTDDALRLVMVRDLLAGRGWYDQAIPRLAPPDGAYMHWSRLLDGGLAGVMLILRGFVGPATAEWATRNFWPLAWIFPASAGALVVARNLGARSAVLLTAPMMLMDLQLYRQFVPTRIDHHNIQIVMTVLALAGATNRSERPGRRELWAAAGGVAAGLGLAIGLEALVFQALIGAGHGLELARDPRRAARPAGAYGLALAGSSLAFFLIQTPPWRWSMPFCDALAMNLVAALAVAGLGLALAGALGERLSARARVLLLAGVAAAAGAVYLGLDPACVHGPFADMDPRVRPFWFDRIQEVQTLPVMFRLAHYDAILAMTMIAMTCGAGVSLAARGWPRPTTAAVTSLALVIAAGITAYLTWRMQDYVDWIGMPVLGAALSWVCETWLRGRMAPSLAAALLFSPTLVAGFVGSSANSVAKPPKAPPNPGVRCFDPRAFVPLARLPRGLVMATPDLGSYILDATAHSVVVAPYHRLSRQILAVHEAFNAPPALAEARVRALHPDYLVDCPGYPMFLDPGSFGARLGAAPPPWLVRVSAPKASLTIYRLRPAGASKR
jgi:hypothetical protein